MSQSTLPIQIKEVISGTKQTAMAGLLVFLDMFVALDFWRLADREVGTRQGEHAQGWTDGQHIVSAVLLNLANGEHVADLETLESDTGLCELVREAEKTRLGISEHKKLKARWRDDSRTRTFPSQSPARRFLS